MSLYITEHHAVKAYGTVELKSKNSYSTGFLNTISRDECLLIVLQQAFLCSQFLAFEVIYHVVVCSSVYRVLVGKPKEKRPL